LLRRSGNEEKKANDGEVMKEIADEEGVLTFDP
jgi:hypothetical protein